jgi:hypothetical protein
MVVPIRSRSTIPSSSRSTVPNSDDFLIVISSESPIALSSERRFSSARNDNFHGSESAANRILGRTGTAFWQDESFDHWIRSGEELQNLIEYVENNPLKAGLVETKEQWPWSSAAWVTDDEKRSSVPPLIL